uniref:Uncharacterized protein n=1 Tax=Ascaris lumbricoides TaxID=6252 RepID=A0A0M3IPK3_ASCLU
MFYLLLYVFISSSNAFLFMPPGAGECSCPSPPPCLPVKPCPPPPSCPQAIPCSTKGSKTYEKDRLDELELVGAYL